MAKHTPTPWRAQWVRPDPKRGHTFEPTCSIVAADTDGRTIRLADIPDPLSAEEEANAALIVRAVNAHDALVSALEAMVHAVGPLEGRLARSIGGQVRMPAMERARDALKLAKGE